MDEISPYYRQIPYNQEAYYSQQFNGNEKRQHVVGDTPQPGRSSKKEKYYVPLELHTAFLLGFCVLTLVIFVLLQIAAAAAIGAPGLNALVARSAQADCPPGATCAPNPGGYTNFTPSPSPSPSPTAPSAPPGGSSTNFGEWKHGSYFIASYLPTLTAIIFSIPWRCVFSRLKEMEPFYQLTQSGGAKAKDSVLLTYANENMVKIFFTSAVGRHILALIGSVNMLLITLCTALAAEVLFVTTLEGSDSSCYSIDPDDIYNHCTPMIEMRPWLAWLLSGVIFVIFASTVYLIIRLRQRKSGIFAEATSIAGIATLYNRSCSLQPSQMYTRPYDKYALQEYRDGTGSNIIVALSPSYRQPPTTTISAKRRKSRTNISKHPAVIALFWLFLIAILILILYYRFVSKPGTGNGLEDFMDSQSFGVRLFMSCIGIAIKLYWGMLETHIRRQAPYAVMAQPQGAQCQESILVHTPSHPFTALFYRSTWATPVLAFTTMMTIFSEILVIVLPAIPFSLATARRAFEISVYISTAILSLMIIVIPVLVLPVAVTWRLVRVREIPEPPESIAETMELLGDTDVSERFSRLGRLDGKKRNEAIRSWWDLRWFVRRTGADEKSDLSGWKLTTNARDGDPLRPDTYI